MKLDPFLSVDETLFTSSMEEVLCRHGTPLRTTRNEVGLNELDYGRVVFRFQDGGRLEEITQPANVVDLGPVAVPFSALSAFVRAQDPGSFERAGFIVSPRFGLAFVPDQPPWVTALAQHCLVSWRSLGANLPPERHN